jgi:alpha-L-arabinofuranosidase
MIRYSFLQWSPARAGFVQLHPGFTMTFLRPSQSLVSRTAVALVLLSGAARAAETAGGPQAVEVTIDAGTTYAPISPYLYGMFVEHIGGIVNHGLWAEMLDDRKFYYPIVGEEPPAPPTRFGREPLRRWTRIGPEDAVVMDAAHAFVGEHSPMVTLAGAEARGLRQAGLSLLKGRAYTGRIVLAGDPQARVTVSLVWGPGAGDRAAVSVGGLGSAYATYPLRFVAGADGENGVLEISGSGGGSFHVGAISLMPGDNVEGFRREVVDQLKRLHSGVYRFPGGNFVSAHEWRDAIGPIDRRPPLMDPVWEFVQPNDVGTDEFMTLCRLLGVEPYITVNAGFGDAWSAAQYVEYANGAATTAMGRVRAANGHPEPYRVKFWGVGNEAWGEWQFGAMSLKQFEVKNNLFATAMRRVDPTIKLIASGAMPDAMTGSKQALRFGPKLVPDPLSPADWTGGMLLRCLENMDLISEHFYSYSGERFDLATGDRMKTDPNEPLVDWMRRPANHVRSKFEAYQDYLTRIPALKAKPVPIALDEWAYVGLPPNSYKIVPAYAWTFHEMFRHSDLYQLAGFTFATSLLSATRNQAVLNPSGLLFMLYRDHFGTIPVAVLGHSPQPAPKYPPGGEEPRVNAGSDTFPLDVAAAWSADRRSLTVAVVNPTDSVQSLEWSIRGADLAGPCRLRRMAPSSIDASIVVGKTPGVAVEERELGSVPSALSISPFSVNLYELPVR